LFLFLRLIEQKLLRLSDLCLHGTSCIRIGSDRCFGYLIAKRFTSYTSNALFSWSSFRVSFERHFKRVFTAPISEIKISSIVVIVLIKMRIKWGELKQTRNLTKCLRFNAVVSITIIIQINKQNRSPGHL